MVSEREKILGLDSGYLIRDAQRSASNGQNTNGHPDFSEGPDINFEYYLLTYLD